MSDTQSDPAPSAPTVTKPPMAQFVIALVALVLAALGFASLIYTDMPDSKLAIMSTFVGVAFGWAGGIMTFYFGTSLSSQGKDADLAGVVRRMTGGN